MNPSNVIWPSRSDSGATPCRRRYHALSLSTRRRSASVLCLIFLVGAICVSHAQLLSQSEPNNLTDGYYQRFFGWDFTGLTPIEQLFANSIVDPAPWNAVLDGQKTEQQKQDEAISAFAITNPEVFVQQFPQYKEPRQIEEEADAAYAMLHPRTYAEQMKMLKTKEQLELESWFVWSITQPKEFNRAIKPLKTPDEIAAAEYAAADAEQPPQLPAPLLRWTPVSEEIKAYYNTQQSQEGSIR